MESLKSATTKHGEGESAMRAPRPWPTCYTAHLLDSTFRLIWVEPVTPNKSCVTALVVAFAMKVSFPDCAVIDLFSQAAVSRAE